MANKFSVFSRQPKNAFGNWNDVPASQDKTYHISDHKITLNGLKNALGRRQQELSEYSESHGSMAIHSAWIELNEKKLAKDVLATMAECDLDFSSIDEFQKQYKNANDLIIQVNKEMDARYA